MNRPSYSLSGLPAYRPLASQLDPLELEPQQQQCQQQTRQQQQQQQQHHHHQEQQQPPPQYAEPNGNNRAERADEEEEDDDDGEAFANAPRPRVSYRWFAILCVIALLTASLHQNVHMRLTSHEAYFNFFLFSQQWSPGYCLGEGHCNASRVKPFWTIHGLWPSNDTSWPANCNNSAKFNVSRLDSIRADLDLYWPSETTTNSERFWRHEWQTHGSCAMHSAGLSTEVAYFNATLNLLRAYNVTNFLLEANILPTLNRTYSVDELRRALTDDLMAKANIVCHVVQGFAAPVLSEVRICLSKTDLRPIDCKIKHEHCGNGTVYYVPTHAANLTSVSSLDGWSQLIVNTFSFYVNYFSPI